jgi:hypothetical protein
MNSHQQILLQGFTDTASIRRVLTAGPLSAQFDQGALRNIRMGSVLVLQQIYSAVRDQNWGTVVPTIMILEEQQTPDSHVLVFESDHRQNDIHFRWTGTIRLAVTPSNPAQTASLTFAMKGEARTTFLRNRIGFCVLHDASIAGQPCQIVHTDGSATANARFPDVISPHQPYVNIRSITHWLPDGMQVLVTMTGDTFEMEDQRNWTDASFKTYCTPLALPFPARIEAGTSVEQTVEITFTGDLPQAQPLDTLTDIHLVDERVPLPHLGTCLADEALSDDQLDLLRSLRLATLRVDVDAHHPQIGTQLDTAHQIASKLHTRLDIALWLSDSAAEDLASFLSAWELHAAAPLTRYFLVFQQGHKCTPASTLRLASQTLGCPVIGGTDAFFTELNRDRPDIPSGVAGVTYSTNPQVHAFDNASLIETLAMQGENLRSARTFCGNLPVLVSPVTLKMRWNPNATSAPLPTPVGELPATADVRQASLFGAVWTMGSIKHHAENGAHTVHYYKTHGIEGFMPPSTGNPLPGKFPEAHRTFPPFLVLAEIAQFSAGSPLFVQRSSSSQPRTAEALALVNAEGQIRWLLANYTPQTQRVRLSGLTPLRGRSVNADNVRQITANPEVYLREWPLRFGADGSAVFDLPPYGLLILETIP